MNIIEIVQDFLTGEPIEDAIIIGILFTMFYVFIDIMFSSIFSIFRKD